MKLNLIFIFLPLLIIILSKLSILGINFGNDIAAAFFEIFPKDTKSV